MTDDDLRARHPRFAGDLDHLRRFAEVIDSPPVTEARGQALAAWRAFNTVPVVPGVAQRRMPKPSRAADELAGAQGRSGADAAGTPIIVPSGAVKLASWVAYRGKRGVDLRGVELPYAFLGTVDLGGARLDDANLADAKLRGARLHDASLVRTDLSRALLLGADLRGADLSDACLAQADLREADLSGCCLDRADLRGADLTRCALVDASVDGARLDGCRVYGTSAWKLRGQPASSDDLVITPAGEPELSTDRLALAQFIYLLLEHGGMRDVIDTLTSKTVLLLGRFTPERKATLDALRAALRKAGYVPLLFDFDKPASKSVSDTVRLLAQMARFIVVDLSDPASAPFELGLLVSLGLSATPLVPLIRREQKPFAMFDDIQALPWVLPLVPYADTARLLAGLEAEVIRPVEARLKQLRRQAGDR